MNRNPVRLISRMIPPIANIIKSSALDLIPNPIGTIEWVKV